MSGQIQLPRCSATCWQCPDADVQLPQLVASPHVLGQLAPCHNMAADTPHTVLPVTSYNHVYIIIIIIIIKVY